MRGRVWVAQLLNEGHGHGGRQFRGIGRDYDIDDDDGAVAEQNNDERRDDDGAIPSFDGAIAGTGVISRLTSLDPTSARGIVQAYLDSNASIRSMPLSHSLAYFRQALLRHPSHLLPQAGLAAAPNVLLPDNGVVAAKNAARNAALFFTLLGAAYMRAQQGGGGGRGVSEAVHVVLPLPNPGDVLNEENVEALKSMMLRVGLAGGFFLKAGKTVKERVDAEQQRRGADAAVAAGRDRADGANCELDGGGRTSGDGDASSSIIIGVGANGARRPDDVVRERGGNDDSASEDDSNGATHAANGTAEESLAQGGRSSQQRSSSIGSLEDLSHMILHPSSIALRLYNAFSNANAFPADSNASTANLDDAHPKGGEDNLDTYKASSYEQQQQDGTSLPKKRRHRGKRSHKTLRPELNDDDGTTSEEEKKSSEPEQVTDDELQSPHEDPSSSLTPEEMAYAMDHPFSPNPYDHPSASSLNAAGASAEAGDRETPSSGGGVAASEATSFFSFNLNHTDPSSAMSTSDSGNVPTGCIGAYARAVRSAASEVTRLVKAERKANFDALPQEEQQDLCVRFIDACTTDDTLHIVKDMLQRRRWMDVDRFFVGQDDTETCALHAAAFNGAERVLEFLCGGIDERDPERDCGLCDVDVRDGNGWTALHFAAGANSVTSVRVLSGHGAKLTIEASNG